MSSYLIHHLETMIPLCALPTPTALRRAFVPLDQLCARLVYLCADDVRANTRSCQGWDGAGLHVSTLAASMGC